LSKGWLLDGEKTTSANGAPDVDVIVSVPVTRISSQPVPAARRRCQVPLISAARGEREACAKVERADGRAAELGNHEVGETRRDHLRTADHHPTGGRTFQDRRWFAPKVRNWSAWCCCSGRASRQDRDRSEPRHCYCPRSERLESLSIQR